MNCLGKAGDWLCLCNSFVVLLRPPASWPRRLNCENGPAAVPCNQCDICRSISAGEDVDVLEIDGASNRGIDEIRQLRQNVNVRPSRARFKIYIIDEVHMLTREAFNALLKTLEEPPEHVKFIFCTTEPTKIPITILSRCQRFDFAGILDPLDLSSGCGRSSRPKGSRPSRRHWRCLPGGRPARCATASRCWSNCWPSAPGRITVADVHGMLGTAGDERLAALVAHLIEPQRGRGPGRSGRRARRRASTRAN